VTDQIQDEWGPYLIEAMRDPEFRAACDAAASEPPPVEFHRSTYLLVIAAALLGWALIVGAVWYALGGGW
jgi:hypothetical protein